jgi:hypothetical protein
MIYASIYADASGESHYKNVNVEFSQADFAPPAPPLYLSSFSPALQYFFLQIPCRLEG